MKKLLGYGVAGTAAAYISYKIFIKQNNNAFLKMKQKKPPLSWQPPNRKSVIERLKKTHFDILIIGGGSAGTGCAFDAALRGLKTALVEKDDFAAETSSKSTKLLHGGIRYLEKALKCFDYEQFKLVREGLQERSAVMKMAPHLTQTLPIMIPVYGRLLVPYFLAGMKLYDFIALNRSLGGSYFLSRSKAIAEFPAIKKEGLSGAVVYNDGQFDDARMNVALAVTAAYHGAATANYVEVAGLLTEDGAVRGATCRDVLTGECFEVRARGVINSTGPFMDSIRAMYKTNVRRVVQPSSGVHLVLPKEYAPRRMGLVLPQTADGRVVFFLPWRGHALVGTTDTPCDVEARPRTTDADADFLLSEVRSNITTPETLDRGSVLAAWAGIRPLVRDPGKASTQALVRNHLIHVSENKLVSLSGGKWTTFRNMAKETIDRAVSVFALTHAGPCISDRVCLIGGHGYSQDLHLKVARDLKLSVDTAASLVNHYGDRAYKFTAYNKKNNKSDKCLNKSDKYLSNEKINEKTNENLNNKDIHNKYLNNKKINENLSVEYSRDKDKKLCNNTINNSILNTFKNKIVNSLKNRIVNSLKKYIVNDHTNIHHFDKISPLFDNLQAEIEYCIDNEMALRPCDILARRTRIAFLNVDEARKAVHLVANIMSKKLNWSSSKKKYEIKNAFDFLDTLGLPK